MQTVCESGCLSLYPIADDESYSKGTIAFTFAQKEQLAPPRGNPIPWCVPKGSTTGIFRLGTSVATALLLAQTDFPSKSVRRKFLWVPRLGAPSIDRQRDLTIVEYDSCVGAPTEAAPRAQFRGKLKF